MKNWGRVEGVEVESLSTKMVGKLNGKFAFDSSLPNLLFAYDEVANSSIMKNGKWAKIISTPNRELSKEEWNERIGEVQVKINEIEEKLNELRKLV